MECNFITIEFHYSLHRIQYTLLDNNQQQQHHRPHPWPGLKCNYASGSSPIKGWCTLLLSRFDGCAITTI